MFANKYSPTKEELYRWGKDDDAYVPCEDFDLLLDLTVDEGIEFVLDDEMTKSGKQFFLSYVCLRLGELLRARKYKEVKEFIKTHQNHPSQLIKQLCNKLEQALSQSFSYHYWCSGGLSNELLGNK